MGAFHRLLEKWGFVKLDRYGLVRTPDDRIMATRPAVLDDGMGGRIVGWTASDLAASELQPWTPGEVKPRRQIEPPVFLSRPQPMPEPVPRPVPVPVLQQVIAPVVAAVVAPPPPAEEDDWEWEIAAARARAAANDIEADVRAMAPPPADSWDPPTPKVPMRLPKATPAPLFSTSSKPVIPVPSLLKSDPNLVRASFSNTRRAAASKLR